VQPRGRSIEGERFPSPSHARFEDRRAEKRVAEICDGILRRLSELQSGEMEKGLPGRRSLRRRSE